MSNAKAAVRAAVQSSSSIVDRLGEIPTLPARAMQICMMIQDPNSSRSEVAEILKQDQALTAKVLKLVNSGYYAIPGGVADVKKALSFLGFNTLAQLVLGVSVQSVFKGFNDENFTMESFWKHATAVGVCSEMLAKQLKYPKPEEVFTCGLLHDIGKLAWADLEPQTFKATLAVAKSRSLSFWEAEKGIGLVDHATLGQKIAEKWGLPQVIRVALGCHHLGDEAMGVHEASHKFAAAIVRIADMLVVKNKYGSSGNFSNVLILESHWKSIGLTSSAMSDVEARLALEMERAGALLSAYR